jgi:uncharacterized protein YcbX
MQATIAQLWIYPIKGCAGIRLSQASALPTGLQHDRCMLVVDAQSGRFLTQRSHPKMALIHPSIDKHQLTMSMAGRESLSLDLKAGNESKTITVWRDTLPAIDMGNAAAQWFSDALGTDVRLVRFDPTQRREVRTNAQQHYLFADGFPFLVLSLASVNVLNERLISQGQNPVGADRFRVNIILDGVDAHTEDYAASLSHANGSQIELAAPCTRCAVPNIDQLTGVSNAMHEPSATLSAYRYDKELDGVTFGMNAFISKTCEIREGDELKVKLAF